MAPSSHGKRPPRHRTSVEPDVNPIGLGYLRADLLVDATSSERVDELKREIALKRYDVDAGVVADALDAKMRLVREGRRALATTEADQIQTVAEALRRPR